MKYKICTLVNVLKILIGIKGMVGRGGAAPTKKWSQHLPVPPVPPVKHEKNPQLPLYQAKMFRVPPFAIFFCSFLSPPLLDEGACHERILWLFVFTRGK